MENTKIQKYADDLFQRFPELLSSSESIFQAYSIIENAFFKSKILFICGNGGSAADAEHITGELSKGFLLKRELSPDLKSKMNERLGENIDHITCKLQMGLKAMVLSAHQAVAAAVNLSPQGMDPEPPRVLQAAEATGSMALGSRETLHGPDRQSMES